MSDENTTWILYHDPVSICSIMVRYTFALRGGQQCNGSELQLQEKVCDLRCQQQLTEHYLCEIKPNGEVPVIALVTHESGLKPIADSVAITWFMASRNPSLLPKEHEENIRRLVTELHGSINFFSPHVRW